jgi:hypothetical protein
LFADAVLPNAGSIFFTVLMALKFLGTCETAVYFPQMKHLSVSLFCNSFISICICAGT